MEKINNAIIMVNYLSIKFNTSFTDIFISRDNNRLLAILCDTDTVRFDLHIKIHYPEKLP